MTQQNNSSTKDYVGSGYAVRARHKFSSRKKLISTSVLKTVLALAIAILALLICVFYSVPHNQPNGMPPLSQPNHRLGNNLPPKPVKRWQYIKELENRQVSVQPIN